MMKPERPTLRLGYVNRHHQVQLGSTGHRSRHTTMWQYLLVALSDVRP
jgi:hypothetical protein